MGKIIYTAIIPFLLNATIVTAFDSDLESDCAKQKNSSFHCKKYEHHAATFSPGAASAYNDLHSSVLDSLSSPENDSPMQQSDDDTTPKTTNSSSEIDSPDSRDDLKDLARLIEWRTKESHTADDDIPDPIECDEHPLFMSCANLLKTYMKKTRSAYTEEEKANFQLALTQIAEVFKSIIPTERYKIVQQLNILAMFKGELTFVKTKGKGRNKTHGEVRSTLANRFRIGKNRQNPMQMQCAQIESGVTTSEEAAFILYDAWEKEGVLDKRVKSCKRRLKSNGFYRYQWPEYELVDLLTYRADNPRIVKKSNYTENKIRRFCKRISKKGRNKNQYIENVALLIAAEWKSQGELNEAIAECAEIVAEAKLWLATGDA